MSQATRRDRLFPLLLAAILLLAALLRLWGITFGIEYGYSSHEPQYISIALDMVKSGDLNPHWFQYPSLLFYLLAGAYALYFLAGVSQGTFVSLADVAPPVQHFMGGAEVPYPTQILAGRAVMVAFALLTVFLVYLVGTRLYSRPVGLLAALLLAVSPIHTLPAHFIQPNTVMVPLVLLAVYLSVQILRAGTTRAYALAGLFAGLAISAKYNAAPVLAVPIIASLLRRDAGGPDYDRLALCLGCAVLGFLLGTPYALLDLPGFLDSFAVEIGHYATEGQIGAEGGAWLWYAGTLFAAEGLIPLLALAGAWRALLTRDRAALLLLLFPLLYYLSMSSLVVRFEWNLTPIVPFLDILAAVGAFWLAERLLAWRPGRARTARAILFLLLLVAVAYPAAHSAARDLNLGQEDVRTTAKHWIEANVPPGARIAQEAFGPFLDPARYDLQHLYLAIDWPPDRYRQAGIEYVVLSRPLHGVFYDDPGQYAAQVGAYDTLIAGLEPLQQWTGPFQDRRGTIAIYRVP